MSERSHIIDEMQIEYEGLFDIKGIYKLIDNWFAERGYEKKEIKNLEYVKPDGKYIEVWLMPWKSITDYAKFEIGARIIAQAVKDVEIEKDGVKTRMNQGKLVIIFDAYLTTDYAHLWEKKPILYVIRTVFDKYIYRFYTNKFESELVGETKQLHSTLKAYLNLYRY